MWKQNDKIEIMLRGITIGFEEEFALFIKNLGTALRYDKVCLGSEKVEKVEIIKTRVENVDYLKRNHAIIAIHSAEGNVNMLQKK